MFFQLLAKRTIIPLNWEFLISICINIDANY